LNKTANKNQTLGDLWDRSKELSDKRKGILGHDPIKEKAEENYSKIRKGRKRPQFED
jgi:hypothetical protein